VTRGDTSHMSALPPPVPEETPERETSSVELLWDLVFVFAVTQVTTLLAAQPSWGRFAQSMLVLALIWWAWSAFVWAANALEADSRLLRGYLLLATVLIFIAGLALPRAFGSEAILFTGAYVLVRIVHMKLYIDAARAGRAGLRAILGFAATTGIGMVLLIIGALAGGWARDALWAVALAIDYAGPAWLTRERLRGLQRVAVAHFADRYGDFVIICLGESIVSVGVGVADSEHQLSVALVATATLGLLIALGMWWTYFDSVAGTARERLGSHQDPVLAAADSYSYLHLVIVAGVIIYAGGIKMVVHNQLGAPMPVAGRLAFCGGVALYLVGVSAFRLRMLGELSRGRLGVAGALLVLFAVTASAPAWTVGAGVTVLIVGLCALESLAEHRSREESEADAAPVAASPASQTVARVADPDHGLE
jgi:low temperature requirement protein LtrA